MDFTSGSKIPSGAELSEIIKTASTNAETDLTPYYEKTTGRELEDFRNQMEDIRTQVSDYVAQESMGYKEKLAQTKQSLRARGMTFSGQSRGQLGKEGALQAKGIEGAIPEERRLEIGRASCRERV